MKLCICLRISLSSNLFCLKTQTWTNNDLENQCILHMKMIFSVQSLSHVWLFENPWTVTCLASLSFANPQSLLKLVSIEMVMPSNHLMLCCPLLLLSSIFPASGSFPMSQFFAKGGQSIWASASASVLPMNIQGWFPLGRTGWISLQSRGLTRVFSNTTVQKYQFFAAQFLSFFFFIFFNSHIHTWLLEKPKVWLDGPLLAK